MIIRGAFKNGGEKMDDESIINLYFDRNEEAIKQTKSVYGNLLGSIANNILHNRQDAEECENEAYLNAWNSIPPSRPKSLGAYMCCIIRRLAFGRYDYNHAAKRGCAVALDELEDVIAGAHKAEDKLNEDNLARLLNNFLYEQDYNTRVIFLRRYWFGDSISEIAKRLKTKEGTVKSKLSRTLKRLKLYLAKEDIDL